MANFRENFKLDTSELQRSLAVLDERVEDFIDADLDLHAEQAEASMKAKAPWRDHTGSARRKLWARGSRNGKTAKIEMGHGVAYGGYLEDNNERRFAIVRPTLEATGRSLMRSFERMFIQLQSRMPPVAALTPEVGGTRPNTTRYRDDRGRFTTKENAKRLARNAASRARYAAKKAAGTLSTRRTKRG